MQVVPEVIDIENPIFYSDVIIAHVIIAHVIIAHVNVEAEGRGFEDASIFCVQWSTCSL
jgi:hypothetical protein